MQVREALELGIIELYPMIHSKVESPVNLCSAPKAGSGFAVVLSSPAGIALGNSHG